MVTLYLQYTHYGNARWPTLMQRSACSLGLLLLVAIMALGQDLAIFEQPMGTEARTQYIALLKEMSLEQLTIDLTSQTSPQRIGMLLMVLSSRGPAAIPILEQYLKARDLKDPASRMVSAATRVAIAKAKCTGTDYVKSLGEMLIDHDNYVVDAAADELRQIGSAEAINTLKLYEKKGRATIKIARLQAQYAGLAPRLRVAAILESARSVIREHKGTGDPALVAEASLLAWEEESAEPTLKGELAQLPRESSDVADKRFRGFLERVLGDLARARTMKQATTPTPMDIDATLDKYLSWVASKEIADQPNPFREPLLKEGSAVSAYIAANKDRFARPQVPVKLVWLVGEIGSSACFDMLLDEYQERPNYRTAVSLAACTGSLQIEQLVNSLKDGKLQGFLKHILSQEAYNTLTDASSEQIVEYWRKHFTEIRNRCIQLSRPQLG
ncbi:MAG: hypothetical protein U1E05_15530 [Patescibacteria group bacterium]|nr:hypothetical protein [Patescibacteria group bacterium]